MFRVYKNPKATGWLGWFEDANGKATAFVGLDRKVVFMSDLSFDTAADESSDGG